MRRLQQKCLEKSRAKRNKIREASEDRVAPTFVLKYNIRTRSLAGPGVIEDGLAVENDVVPFDRADVLGAGLRQGLPW